MLELTSIRFKINKIFYLASKNVKSSLKEVVLGYYFWIIASFFIITLAKTFIFSNLLNVDAIEYFFYLSFFLAIWQFLNNCIVSSLNIFFRNQLPLNFQINPFELITIKYIEYSIHLFVKLIVIFIINLYFNKISFLIILDNMFLFIVFSYFLSIFFSLLGVLYRDLSQFIISAMQISFFLTPILWMPDQIDNNLIKFLQYNPFYYLINFFYDGFNYLNTSVIKVNVMYILIIEYILFFFIKKKFLRIYQL